MIVRAARSFVRCRGSGRPVSGATATGDPEIVDEVVVDGAALARAGELMIRAVPRLTSSACCRIPFTFRNVVDDNAVVAELFLALLRQSGVALTFPQGFAIDRVGCSR